ncbi:MULTISPECIES: hypothetical protein [Cyanophyceae]|uniref:hypothetical protein n=1 Tax=Cyanophyceae TaxID=3028117 RepID=UPI0016868BC7|nr:hypothetical protein [Trichocoleus sp. FACHB-40]MBD2005999.1 hypothetical protein [Trichocoleus sp. FACHB-40]
MQGCSNCLTILECIKFHQASLLKKAIALVGDSSRPTDPGILGLYPEFKELKLMLGF